MNQKAKAPGVGIVDIVAACILLFIGAMDSEFDWGLISLVAGIGILVMGILELVGRSSKPSGILRLITGIALFGVGAICAEGMDWTYIALTSGGVFTVTGILDIIDKPKVLGILEIIGGAILLVLALMTIQYDWGLMALVTAVSCVVGGIINLVKRRE